MQATDLLDFFELVPIGITISDKDGNIVSSNKEGARILGLKNDGTDWTLDDPRWHCIRRDLTVIPPEEYVSVRVQKGRCIVENIEAGVACNDKVTWLNITAAPLSDEGVIVAYVDITRNIEHEKKLEELIKDREKLINIIAHDLRNPFTTILGFIDLLKEELTDKSSVNLEKYVQIIQSASQQTFDMLESLLEWSKSRAGITIYNPGNIDITQLVVEAINFFRNIENKKGITFRFDFDNHCVAWADRNMIGIVLRNLLTNAVKYSYPNGEVIVSVKEVNSGVAISIKDFGVGIEPERLKLFFDPTHAKSLPGTAMEKGSGLGLLICHEFIAKHGGTINVESEPGKGSNFSVNIPSGRWHFRPVELAGVLNAETCQLEKK